MFKFTIRDLLWLTVVVALGVGWWIDHSTVSAEARDAEFWRNVALAKHARLIEIEKDSGKHIDPQRLVVVAGDFAGSGGDNGKQ